MLIGINGFKRSGKGETGRAVQDLMGDRRYETTTLLGFADKLKIIAAKALGYTDLTDQECVELMDRCKETWLFTIDEIVEVQPNPFPIRNYQHIHRLSGRQYLQWFGTEARKVFGDDFWVDQVLPLPEGIHVYVNGWQQEWYGTSHVAFTDLRFPNEAQRILDLGGEVWEVLRPGTNSDGHDSELVLPRELVTRQIHNSGDLMNLRFQVEKALGL